MYIDQVTKRRGLKSTLTLGYAMPSKVTPSSLFGKLLTQHRQARGLTQTQLAELVGSTQRAISHYETVAEYPPTPMVVALAQALEVSADELLGLRAPKQRTLPVMDSETKRLWKQFQRVKTLPEKDRRAVIRMINSIASAQTPNGRSRSA